MTGQGWACNSPNQLWVPGFSLMAETSYDVPVPSAEDEGDESQETFGSAVLVSPTLKTHPQRVLQMEAPQRKPFILGLLGVRGL